MRKMFITAALLLLFGFPAFAQAPTLLPGDFIAFDYSNADFTTFQVLRFEVKWDTQTTWTAITAAPFTDAQTGAGMSSYAVAPPFSSGNHSVSVRACNVVGCGNSSNPFSFAYVANSVPPATFGNFRKKAQ